MREQLDAWECECGHVEYGTYPPEECKECWQIHNFKKVDENKLDSFDELEGGI